MFTTTAFLEVENTYRREQLRRAWGGPVLARLRRRARAAAGRPASRRASGSHVHAVAGAR
ncbi:hypothetical protein [Ornithinimicrobium pekingense]|nr:hypothetical protein [Ornithinimicrobium pekingense]